MDSDSPDKTQPVPQAEAHPLQQDQYQDYGNEEGYFEEQEITGALVASRQNKKKAADDAKLLANRIALLKLEEKKAWKKIEETKKKAEQVMKIRERNEADRRRKDDLRRQRADEEAHRYQQNQAMKQATQHAIQNQN
mmetsp:Transcript_6541/g.10509  ORF Transcript_6541/g.10509 Transcript_6541/m.10509 type:complete len:137 (-) Transcript_6541:473-883(-)